MIDRFGSLTGDVLSAASSAFLAGSGQPYAEKPFTPLTVRQRIAAVLGSRAEH